MRFRCLGFRAWGLRFLVPSTLPLPSLIPPFLFRGNPKEGAHRAGCQGNPEHREVRALGYGVGGGGCRV